MQVGAVPSGTLSSVDGNAAASSASGTTPASPGATGCVVVLSATTCLGSTEHLPTSTDWNLLSGTLSSPSYSLEGSPPLPSSKRPGPHPCSGSHLARLSVELTGERGAERDRRIFFFSSWSTPATTLPSFHPPCFREALPAAKKKKKGVRQGTLEKRNKRTLSDAACTSRLSRLLLSTPVARCSRFRKELRVLRSSLTCCPV